MLAVDLSLLAGAYTAIQELLFLLIEQRSL
jgi:hypothetical protein